MKILVVGGAGYIGSHMVQLLNAYGHDVVTLDNLCSGYRETVLCGDFILGDMADINILNHVFEENIFDGVMHFASHIQVSESFKEPSKYYFNNFANTQNLLEAMIRNNVKYFIFSSSAAIFGNPDYCPVDEEHRKYPINPYGRTKYMVEQMLDDYDYAYGLKSISLRYFNAAGAHPKGILGERHKPETHLIPLVLQAASERVQNIKIFGNDYDTKDGTCIRDYIHVMDLCDAHILALDWARENNRSEKFNLGNGSGFSVKEVIETAKKVTNKKVKIVEEQRRLGDPPVLVADSTKIKRLLGWKPQYPELETIIMHAWQWEQKYPWSNI